MSHCFRGPDGHLTGERTEAGESPSFRLGLLLGGWDMEEAHRRPVGAQEAVGNLGVQRARDPGWRWPLGDLLPLYPPASTTPPQGPAQPHNLLERPQTPEEVGTCRPGTGHLARGQLVPARMRGPCDRACFVHGGDRQSLGSASTLVLLHLLLPDVRQGPRTACTAVALEGWGWGGADRVPSVASVLGSPDIRLVCLGEGPQGGTDAKIS